MRGGADHTLVDGRAQPWPVMEHGSSPGLGFPITSTRYGSRVERTVAREDKFKRPPLHLHASSMANNETVKLAGAPFGLSVIGGATTGAVFENGPRASGAGGSGSTRGHIGGSGRGVGRTTSATWAGPWASRGWGIGEPAGRVGEISGGAGDARPRRADPPRREPRPRVSPARRSPPTRSGSAGPPPPLNQAGDPHPLLQPDSGPTPDSRAALCCLLQSLGALTSPYARRMT